MKKQIDFICSLPGAIIWSSHNKTNLRIKMQVNALDFLIRNALWRLQTLVISAVYVRVSTMEISARISSDIQLGKKRRLLKEI